MKNFLQRYAFIIFLSFVVMLMIVIKIINGNVEQNTENNKTTPTKIPITTIPTPFPSTETDAYDPKPGYSYNIFLPYDGEIIRIEKYSKPYILEVLINSEEDKIEAEVEVEEWIKENEIYPEKTSFVFKIEE